MHRLTLTSRLIFTLFSMLSNTPLFYHSNHLTISKLTSSTNNSPAFINQVLSVDLLLFDHVINYLLMTKTSGCLGFQSVVALTHSDSYSKLQTDFT